MIKLFSLATVSLFCLLSPVLTQATDTRVTSITVDAISDQTPGSASNYTVSFTTVESLSFISLRYFPVTDGAVGSSSAAGFSFANATVGSDDFSGTGISVSDGIEYTVMFSSTLPSGDYTFTLSSITNSSTESDYTLGGSTAFNAVDGDYTTATPFTISSDPCVAVTTVELADVAATTFGTNAVITRGESETIATSYQLAYATTQTAIDNDTATTVDMTTETSIIIEELVAKTLYYFQVSALDANNCVLARTSVSATTQRAIAKQRYAKPTVNKITKRTAVAHWVADDFVDTYDLQLWSKTKLLKRFNNLTALKKALTKKQLQSDKLYKVRVRADYSTDETTRWSKFKQFTTN